MSGVIDSAVALENWEPAGTSPVRKWTENYEEEENSDQYIKYYKVTEETLGLQISNTQDDRCLKMYL